MKVIDNSVEFISTPITGIELLIGAGTNKKKQLTDPDHGEAWRGLVTLDIDPGCEPDVLWDLNHMPLPFNDGSFEEIHAYEVLEHFGQQGDWRTFFKHFEEFHRILKPGGRIFATVPMWDTQWAWGDPGHTRVITPGTIQFLSQECYQKGVGTTTMTDYRNWYKVDFEIEGSMEGEERYCFVLKKK